MAVLYDLVHPAPRWLADPVGAAAMGDAVALVAPCGRGGIRSRRRHLHRKRGAI